MRLPCEGFATSRTILLEIHTMSTTPDQYTRTLAAADSIRKLHPARPTLGIILGSGLGNFASQVENPTTIPYADIPGWPLSTVQGHSGKLILGVIDGVDVAVMQGRVHAYEGYGMNEVVFPTRVLALLGCTSLIVTNAALGPNEPKFAITPAAGQRFFDMSSAYSYRLRKIARVEAAAQDIPLPEGVYLAVLGPSYETPAEIRAFRTLGADLVGMSTVHEVIVARHMGLEVLGLSLVTNMAAGVMEQPINHEEVMEMGKRVEAQFTSLVKALVPQVAGVVAS